MKSMKLLLMLMLAQFANNTFCAEVAKGQDVGQEKKIRKEQKKIKNKILDEAIKLCNKKGISIHNNGKIIKILRNLINKYSFTELSEADLFQEVLKRQIIIDSDNYMRATGITDPTILRSFIVEKIKAYNYSGNLSVEDIFKDFLNHNIKTIRQSKKGHSEFDSKESYEEANKIEDPVRRQKQIRFLNAVNGGMNECSNCKKVDENLGDRKKEFKKCSACEIVRYCCKECQKTHWKKEHKEDCRYFQVRTEKDEQEYLDEIKEKESGGSDSGGGGASAASGSDSGSASGAGSSSSS